MKFFFVVLSICCYLISQTMIDARTTGLRKPYWSLSTNGEYQKDWHHQKFDRRRQAGWGKRRDLMMDDESDELPPYHPYASQDNSAHTWSEDT